MADEARTNEHNADMAPLAPAPRDGSDPLSPLGPLGPLAAPTLMTDSGFAGLGDLLLGDAARLATFDAVFGQSPLGVGIFDADCRYVMVNEALQAIIGLPSEQLVGRRIEEVLGPLGVKAGANLRTAMTSGEPLVNQELEGATYAHDAHPRTFLASYFRLADDEGQLIGAASLVADVTEQVQTRRGLAAANKRLALLSRVSAALSSCLDVQDALSAFASLVVPDFADHCVIDLIDETGEVQRAALLHADGLGPEPEAWVLPGQRVNYPHAHPALTAMIEGHAVVEQAGGDPNFPHLAPTPESARQAASMGVHSAMTVPLIARGEVVGAVSFVTSGSGRVLGDSDVEMGEELASRVAIAIDNARLYSREQRIALTLQRSLLPEQLPATPALQTAAVYLPAALDGSVGGDWYDVIPLPCGRVGLVMGDVMGRGVPAAALMGQLRAAVRAYASQDLPPAELLGYLDTVVRGLADDTLVTCVYSVYDPVDETLTVANAGHLPPLLVTAAGAQRLGEHGIVLGAGSGSYDQVEVPFRGDSLLALYTDGLVERRAADIDRRIDALGARLVGRDDPLPALCADAATLAGDARDVDDVAVMLVRPNPVARPLVARLDVVPHAARVRDIRRFAMDTLLTWGEPEQVVEPVELIVSELLTNVIRHASGHQASVRLERHFDRVVVAVLDPDSAPPRLTRAEPEDEGGRGLHLVDAVADRWGARNVYGGGKVVWCELFTPGPIS